MNNKITITATDGKVFTGTIDGYADLVGELNAYESDLKLKQEKEAAENEAREEAKKYRFNQVLDKLDALNKVVESYEKETGEKLEYITVNGKLKTQGGGYIGKYTGMPIINLSTIGTHDNWWNEIYKAIRKS